VSGGALWIGDRSQVQKVADTKVSNRMDIEQGDYTESKVFTRHMDIEQGVYTESKVFTRSPAHLIRAWGPFVGAWLDVRVPTAIVAKVSNGGFAFFLGRHGGAYVASARSWGNRRPA
jgi:hypothetical protein